MSSARGPAAGHCRLGPLASLDLAGLEELASAAPPPESPPDYLHLDVSDGQFFSPATFGTDMVKSLRARLPNTFLDVHLMVADPHKYVDELANAGANQLTFHVEAIDNPEELISSVKEKGMKVGVAIKPASSVQDVLPLVTQVDSVLVMTAEPGCKAQEFTVEPSSKMEAIRRVRPNLEIKTDGWWEELSKSQVHVHTNGSINQHSTGGKHPKSPLKVTFGPTKTTPSSTRQTVVTCTCTSRSYGTVYTCTCPAATNGGGAYHSVNFSQEGSFDPESQPLIGISTNGVSNSRRSSVQCSCHTKVEDNTARRAKIKLIIASLIALLFMIGEVLGGYFAGSLAIMTDAAHMLSDFAGFLISLFAIWLASRPSSSRMSFGWHRAEVMGAVISVLIIWVITGVLFYEAILRVMHPERYQIDANIMLITACIGVYVNVLMVTVLHQHSHGHGHGHGHDHKASHKSDSEHQSGEGLSLNDVSSPDVNKKRKKFWPRKRSPHKHGSEENINVRAAFIHVIGDLIQSVGVVIAGYIIWFKPEWKIADPICTFIFCILVLISTLNVLKDALRVLMEGTPKHIDYKEVKNDLMSVPGVRNAHSLHIWSLTLNKTALAAHLVLDSEADHQNVLDAASKMLKQVYNVTSTTLQVEGHHDLMENCDTCQETNNTKFCNVCWPL